MWGFRKSANYTEVFYPAQDSLIHILLKSDNCNIKLFFMENNLRSLDRIIYSA